MKGVIIAAGYGSRLWNVTNNIPKTLLPFGAGTILSTIINRLQQAGITSLCIVVGYNQKYIREYLAKTQFSLPIQIIDNQLWDKGNGISVYQVKAEIDIEPFILSMSDHIVSVPALEKMVQAEERTNLLLVDPFIQANFDLDDATKVLVQDTIIAGIGKELQDYNALDCGIFRLEPDFFPAVDKAVSKGKESISAAISELILSNRMKVVQLDKPNQWLDIDTPEAYQYALQQSDLI
jgi:choline kinase